MTARPGLGEQSKRLAAAVEAVDLLPLMNYVDRYLDTSEVLNEIINTAAHLCMLMSLHSTEVLEGARARWVEPGLWIIEVLPED